MIVTRSVSEGSLGEDVRAQFTAQPTAIMVAGGAMVFLGILPNTPHFALLLVGGGLLAGGFFLLRRLRNGGNVARRRFRFGKRDRRQYPDRQYQHQQQRSSA